MQSSGINTGIKLLNYQLHTEGVGEGEGEGEGVKLLHRLMKYTWMDFI